MDEESITSFDISETASRKRSRDDEASAEPAAASRDCIQEGDTVIYLMHDSSQMGSMLKVNPREQQKLGSKKYSVRSLIGRPFGSVFELQQRHLQLVEEYAILDEVPEVALGSAGIGPLKTCGINLFSSNTLFRTDAVGDNSLYHDDNTAQRLKTEDIHLLREQGASGHDIIRSLIQNSDTWGNKSQFAREKWLARKQKRCLRPRLLEDSALINVLSLQICSKSSHRQVHPRYSG